MSERTPIDDTRLRAMKHEGDPVADAIAKVAAGCPPHSAAAGECDMYGTACRSLRLAGRAFSRRIRARPRRCLAYRWPTCSRTE